MSSTLDAQHEESFFAILAADAGASLTYPLQVSALRKGGHVLLKSHPCKISTMTTAKPGKHGHAKVNIEGYDIFTHQKFADFGPAHQNVEVPVLRRREYQLLNVDNDDKFLSLFSYEDGETKDDLKLPEGEVGEKVERLWKGGKRDLVVTVMAAMGNEMVVEVRDNARD